MVCSANLYRGLGALVALAGGVIITGAALAQALPESPLPETSTSLGFETVAAALASLRTRDDVSVSVQNGWTIATDTKARTIWSFAPENYPAYPAVVKRQAVPRRGGGSTIAMSVLCEAEKRPCDELVRTFDRMTVEGLGSSVGPAEFR